MTKPFARLGEVLGLSPPHATLLGLVGLAGLGMATALATRYDMLFIGLAIPFGAIVLLVGIGRPLLSLLLFVALIPIEAVLLIDGFGTVSRLAGILFAVSYAVPRVARLSPRSMPVAAWAFLAWATLSVVWALDPTRAWAELTTLIQLFVIALLIADFVILRPDIVRPVLWTYSVFAAITAVIGIQYYVSSGLASTRAVALERQDPAQFAAVLLPALVFCIYELFAGSRRIAPAAFALVLTAGVVVSGTRGAWLAVGAVVLMLVLPSLPLRRRVLALGAIAACLVLVLQLPGVAELIDERSSTALATGGAGRTDIWLVGLTIFRSAPLAGVGYANFPVAFTPEAIRASDVTSWSFIFEAGRGPHNFVVSTISELGIVGIGLLLWFIGPLVVRRGWGPDAAVVQAALAALLTSALFLDIITNRKQVWLVIGLAAGLALLAAREATSADAGPEPARTRSVTPSVHPGVT